MKPPEVLMIGWGKEMRPALLLHRTARAVPLACGHAMRGLDERGMAPPAPSLYQYPRFLCAFAPWRENVFVTQRRKDAKVNRHRTARAVPLLCRHQSRGIVANRSWVSDFSVNSVFSVVNPVVVCSEEPTPDRSRRSACMRTQNQAIPPIRPRHGKNSTR